MAEHELARDLPDAMSLARSASSKASTSASSLVPATSPTISEVNILPDTAAATSTSCVEEARRSSR